MVYAAGSAASVGTDPTRVDAGIDPAAYTHPRPTYESEGIGATGGVEGLGATGGLQGAEGVEGVEGVEGAEYRQGLR
jgi:hypothetical protein